MASPGLDVAELGETRDPRQLVPGSPGDVTATADRLAALVEPLRTVGDGLRQVRTPGWSGMVSDAFWDQFGGEPVRWHLAGDAMAAVSDGLRRYAEVLEWAQHRAQEAIDLWDEGQAATAQAQAQYAELAQSEFLAGTSGSLPDPGQSYRVHARQLLDHARAQVSGSAAMTSRVVRDNAGRDSGSPAWLAALADTAAQVGPGDDDDDGDDSSGEVVLRPDEAEVTLLDRELLDVEVWEWEWEGSRRLGPATLEGEVELEVLAAEARAEATLSTTEGLRARAEANAALLRAEAEVSATLGEVELAASGGSYVGAQAEGEFLVGRDGVAVAGGVFGGGRAGGEVGVTTPGGLGATVEGEAWLGVGAEGASRREGARMVATGCHGVSGWRSGSAAGSAEASQSIRPPSEVRCRKQRMQSVMWPVVPRTGSRRAGTLSVTGGRHGRRLAGEAERSWDGDDAAGPDRLPVARRLGGGAAGRGG